MSAEAVIMQALFGSDRPLKEYELGLPCMLGEVVCRIVGESDDGSWGEINGVKAYSIPLVATPHGSIIKTGFLRLSEITEEGMQKLLAYEEQVKSEGKQLYAGCLDSKPELWGELITTITQVRFTGKWVEIWVKENLPTINGEPGGYHLSSKSQYLWDAVEKAELTNEIHNTGLVGRTLTWYKSGPNYEIKSIK